MGGPSVLSQPPLRTQRLSFFFFPKYKGSRPREATDRPCEVISRPLQSHFSRQSPEFLRIKKSQWEGVIPRHRPGEKAALTLS